ncbi:hypothetical protein AYO21_00104 [Fonsecaea monophora]|uniref:Zn(2)-C6 fungal-type domain-containing protein n=1 Tax=Fonsecaea monophora TaxID=254056 RepID=A0A177FPL1_9EURO|nr:hypothetical protein AYO21_00104 [Fonsecaea monophora]OAG45470.1 hypothetical protein AYO21_00104 [Fonsecaea monophora]
MSTAAASDGWPVKKRRAPIACTACHARKVRCNVVLVGQPCSNCQQDQTQCALHVSARGKHKRRRLNKNSHLHTVTPPSLSSSGPTADAQTQPPATTDFADSNPSVTPPSQPPSRDEYESQANVEAYRNIVDAVETNGAKVPLYVGELQSLRFIFHVARDKSIASKAHYLVPQPKRRQLSPEEYACLQAKGAFSTESDDLRNELLGLFFDYVYPILPIIDPYDFRRRYEAGGIQSISPLLLQSMFLAASNFISTDGLKRSGWPSLMHMKRRFYERAKALYDFDYETDKICLIQSVLLLGYWLGQAHDRTDSWHWVGVAISLSQSVGLHRDPGFSDVPPSQRSLWRRIWWCCFYRDRCIALGMGRAFRINAEDCDVKELTLEDLVHTAKDSSTSSSSANLNLNEESAAIVVKCNNYAPIFLEIVKLSQILGEVLASVYRPRKEPMSWSVIEYLEDKLARWQAALDPRCRVDMPLTSMNEPIAMTLHKYYIQILHHVTVVTMYKPFVFQDDLLPTRPGSDICARIAWEGCQLSAFAATDGFRKLSELELVRFLPPESVTMLISIIAILFVAKCLSTGMKWHLASQNLDLAMLVVQQLQEKYLAARFIFAYYTAAFEKVAPSQRPLLDSASASTTASSTLPAGSYSNAFPNLAVASATTTADIENVPRIYDAGIDGRGGPGTTSPFDAVESFSSGQEDHLSTWAECFPASMAADFDILFGAEGIMRGFEELV